MTTRICGFCAKHFADQTTQREYQGHIALCAREGPYAGMTRPDYPPRQPARVVTRAQEENPVPDTLIRIEKQLKRMRDMGADLATLEANLRPCKCGKPQVIAAMVFEPGQAKILARCTETDYGQCKLAKRLRRYVHKFDAAPEEPVPSKPATKKTRRTRKAKAKVEPADQGLDKEQATRMLQIMKENPDLSAAEARLEVLDETDEAEEKRAEQAAGIA